MGPEGEGCASLNLGIECRITDHPSHFYSHSDSHGACDAGSSGGHGPSPSRASADHRRVRPDRDADGEDGASKLRRLEDSSLVRDGEGNSVHRGISEGGRRDLATEQTPSPPATRAQLIARLRQGQRPCHVANGGATQGADRTVRGRVHSADRHEAGAPRRGPATASSSQRQAAPLGGTMYSAAARVQCAASGTNASGRGRHGLREPTLDYAARDGPVEPNSECAATQDSGVHEAAIPIAIRGHHGNVLPGMCSTAMAGIATASEPRPVLLLGPAAAGGSPGSQDAATAASNFGYAAQRHLTRRRLRGKQPPPPSATGTALVTSASMANREANAPMPAPENLRPALTPACRGEAAAGRPPN